MVCSSYFQPKVFGSWNIEFAFPKYRDETSNEIVREVSWAISVKEHRDWWRLL